MLRIMNKQGCVERVRHSDSCMKVLQEGKAITSMQCDNGNNWWG